MHKFWFSFESEAYRVRDSGRLATSRYREVEVYLSAPFERVRPLFLSSVSNPTSKKTEHRTPSTTTAMSNVYSPGVKG